MATPDPPDPDSKAVLTALTEAFTKLPALLSYGGLVLVAFILLIWLTGSLPDILLAVPAVALAAFLVYAYLNSHFEMEKEKLKAGQEAEKLRLEAELERLKLQQAGDLAKEQINLEREKLIAPQSAPAPSPPPREEPPSAASWPDSYLGIFAYPPTEFNPQDFTRDRLKENASMKPYR